MAELADAADSSSDEGDDWQETRRFCAPVKHCHEFGLHNDHAADKRCETSQFLHHVGDFSALRGILNLEHLTVVSARQDEHRGTR